MSKRTSIRLPDDLYVRLQKRAEQEHRTVSNLIVVLLTQGLIDSVDDSQANKVASEGRTPKP